MSSATGDPRRWPALLRWAAPTAEAERALRQEISAWLADRDWDEVSALPGGWWNDHRGGDVRGAIVAATTAEAIRDLAREPRRPAGREPRPVALTFPGQGSQFPQMAFGLRRHQPAFAAAVAEVAGLLGRLGTDVLADWRADEPAVPLEDVSRAQPLLFTIDYAMGRLLLAAGVRPAVLLGHSAGESVAAVMAEVFRLSDATALLADRVARIGATPPGGMLAVAASPEQAAPYLGDGVVIGAVNGPGQTMLAGPMDALTRVRLKMDGDGLTSRLAHARQGFHSPLIAGACAGSEALLREMPLCPPRRPMMSGYTAGPVTSGDATDPAFWLMQPAEPVFFGAALDALLRTDYLVVEAGPGQGLTALARRHPAVASGRSDAVPTMPARAADPAQEHRFLLGALARIWAEGHDIDLDAVRLRP